MAGEPTEAVRVEPDRFPLVLEPGWNLVTLPVESTSPDAWSKEHNLQVVDATEMEHPGRSATPEATETHAAERGYWVHSTTSQTVTVEGRAVRSLVVTSTAVEAGWNLIGVQRPVRYGDPNLRRLLFWDARSETYARLQVGTRLQPGRGYWAYAEEDTVPLSTSCLPESWTFTDAAQLIKHCPFSAGQAQIVSHSKWSTNPSQYQNTSLSAGTTDDHAQGTSILIHDTDVSRSTSVQAWAQHHRSLTKSEQPYHFVIAQDPAAKTWTVFEGQPLPPSSTTSEIHVALMGTYEAIRPSLFEKTQYGYDDTASESDAQPPIDAILRLTELVVDLKTHHRIDRLSFAGEEELGPKQAILHVIHALQKRYFTQTDTDKKNAPSAPDTSGDEVAPLLLVFQPTDGLPIQTPWLTLGGEVYDEQLQGLYINGVRVSSASTSFLHTVFLDPGENILTLVAVDRAQNTKRVTRRVFFEANVPEDTAPASESSAARVNTSEDELLASLDPDKEPQLQVWLNGDALPASLHTAEPRVLVKGKSSSPGLSSAIINGTLVRTSSGAFETTLHLFSPKNILQIRVPDQLGRPTAHHFEIVLDQKAPHILFGHPQEETVYEARYQLHGLIDDPHLVRAIWWKQGDEERRPLFISDDRFSVEASLNEGSNVFFVFAEDKAGNTTTERIEVRYATSLAIAQVPSAPLALSGSSGDSRVQLAWSMPQNFADGAPMPKGFRPNYRVYRRSAPAEPFEAVSTSPQTRYEDGDLEYGQTYDYYVTSVIVDAAQKEEESKRSDIVSFNVEASAPAVETGAFERPVRIKDQNQKIRLVKAAVTRHQKTLYAHLVHIVPGASGAGDTLRVLRNSRAGESSSWEPAIVLPVERPGFRITDVAIAARSHRVSVAWICRPEGASEGAQSEVFLLEDLASGSWTSPQPATPIRTSPSWKRGLELAYDDEENLHLVWGEANRVYYAKNARIELDEAGQPKSVFDVDHPAPKENVVRYLAHYPAQEDAPCTCEGCWCEEKYVEPQGDLSWREENYVYTPSLSVSRDAITISAKQTRSFENTPVVNDRWQKMMEKPVYADDIVQRQRPTRFPVGWKKTWKRAYEPGDEALWDTLGFQYQFLYEGTWREQDAIKVAHRPLSRKGQTHADDQDTDWRIRTIDDAFGAEVEDRASHPKIASTAGGRIALVYEKGPSSDPNAVGHNLIYFVESHDGGGTWSEPLSIASGYMPDVALNRAGSLSVLYYVPREAHHSPNEALLGELRIGQQQDDGFEHHVLTTAPAKPIHRLSHDGQNGTLMNVPTIIAFEEMFLAAWIGEPENALDHDHIVVSRSRDDNDGQRISLRRTTPSQNTGTASKFQVVLEDKFHFRVNDNRSVKISASGNGPQKDHSPLIATPEAERLTQKLEALGLDSAPLSAAPVLRPKHLGPSIFAAAAEVTTVDLVNGQAELWLPNAITTLDQGPDTPSEAPEPHAVYIHYETNAANIPGNASGNYLMARTFRDALFVEGQPSDEKPHAYQLEYRTDLSVDPEDSKYLTGRAWVYTQGIALAQRSKSTDKHDWPKAQGLARWLCDHAKKDSSDSTKLRGWHFSENISDGWKDARLVAGASAWAIQGLGTFLASKAGKALPDPQERKALGQCYLGALEGLQDHRVVLSDRLSLMTAGWTTEGLANASTPRALDPALPSYPQDPNEQWEYYDLLDAIGYNTFPDDEEQWPQVRTYTLAADGTTKTYGRVITLSEQDWAAFKIPIKAQNVVTEHNLDTLSVLNHALNHAEILGPQDRAQRQAWETRLRTWRDHVQNGIFELLWDEKTWRDDLSEARANLREKDLGRIVTGGTLDFSGDSHGGVRFKPSRHVAIDNCSWLALSVNYLDLPETHREKLAKCLQYTIGAFARTLRYEGKTYYGTHYFKNEFRDPYIEESALQEDSYHLEATTGLILGLLQYSDAHPEAIELRQEALHLWAEAQEYVREWGFPYSSQRIQNLSTRLSSSTAVIWFIDVYDHLQKTDRDDDRPLKSYAPTIHEPDVIPALTKPLEPFVLAVHQALAERLATVRNTTSDRQGENTFMERIVSAVNGDRRVTHLEDQALSVLVAANVGTAESWNTAGLRIEALLHAIQDGRVPALVSTDGAAPRKGASPIEGEHVTDGTDSADGTDLTGDADLVGPQGNTSLQMLSLYVLAWYLNHVPFDGPIGDQHARLVPAVERTALELFDAVTHERLAREGPFEDLFLHTLFSAPKQRANLVDNVLAAFALEALERALVGHHRAIEIAQTLGRLNTSLDKRAWNDGTKTPVLWFSGDHHEVNPDADTRAHAGLQADAHAGAEADAGTEAEGSMTVTASTRALYALYALRRGLTEQALDALDAPTAHGSTAPGFNEGLDDFETNAVNGWPENNRSGAEEPRWVEVLAPVLARRMASTVDPRQEELAYLAFTQLRHQTEAYPLLEVSTSFLLSLALANHPADFLGSPRAPFVFLPKAPLNRPASMATGAYFSMLQTTLARQFIDGVGALLASEFKAYRYDALIHQLVRVGFGFSQALEGVDVHRWPGKFQQKSPAHAQTIQHTLEHLCDDAFFTPLEEKAGVRLEAYLGVDCRSASRALAKLRVARGSLQPGGVGQLLEPDDDPLVWTKLAQRIHPALVPLNQTQPPTALSDSQDTTHFGAMTPFSAKTPKHFPKETSVIELRNVVQRHLGEVLKQELQNHRTLPKTLLFPVDGQDPLRVLNPTAPEYWQLGALAYRTALEAKGQITFTAGSVPIEAPPFPRTKRLRNNVRTLRRFVHNTADGYLTTSAGRSDLHPGALHRMLRTGRITDADFNRLMASAEPLGNESSENWRHRFFLIESEGLKDHLSTLGVTANDRAIHELALAIAQAKHVPMALGATALQSHGFLEQLHLLPFPGESGRMEFYVDPNARPLFATGGKVLPFASIHEALEVIKSRPLFGEVTIIEGDGAGMPYFVRLPGRAVRDVLVRPRSEQGVTVASPDSIEFGLPKEVYAPHVRIPYDDPRLEYMILICAQEPEKLTLDDDQTIAVETLLDRTGVFFYNVSRGALADPAQTVNFRKPPPLDEFLPGEINAGGLVERPDAGVPMFCVGQAVIETTANGQMVRVASPISPNIARYDPQTRKADIPPPFGGQSFHTLRIADWELDETIARARRSPESLFRALMGDGPYGAATQILPNLVGLGTLELSLLPSPPSNVRVTGTQLSFDAAFERFDGSTLNAYEIFQYEALVSQYNGELIAERHANSPGIGSRPIPREEFIDGRNRIDFHPYDVNITPPPGVFVAPVGGSVFRPTAALKPIPNFPIWVAVRTVDTKLRTGLNSTWNEDGDLLEINPGIPTLALNAEPIADHAIELVFPGAPAANTMGYQLFIWQGGTNRMPREYEVRFVSVEKARDPYLVSSYRGAPLGAGNYHFSVARLQETAPNRYIQTRFSDIATAGVGQYTNIHVDAENGSLFGDGSAEAPFAGFFQALAMAEESTKHHRRLPRIVLHPGNYGTLELGNQFRVFPVVFQGLETDKVIFDRITSKGSRVYLNHLTVRGAVELGRGGGLFDVTADLVAVQAPNSTIRFSKIRHLSYQGSVRNQVIGSVLLDGIHIDAKSTVAEVRQTLFLNEEDRATVIVSESAMPTDVRRNTVYRGGKIMKNREALRAMYQIPIESPFLPFSTQANPNEGIVYDRNGERPFLLIPNFRGPGVGYRTSLLPATLVDRLREHGFFPGKTSIVAQGQSDRETGMGFDFTWLCLGEPERLTPEILDELTAFLDEHPFYGRRIVHEGFLQLSNALAGGYMAYCLFGSSTDAFKSGFQSFWDLKAQPGSLQARYRSQSEAQSGTLQASFVLDLVEDVTHTDTGEPFNFIVSLVGTSGDWWQGEPVPPAPSYHFALTSGRPGDTIELTFSNVPSDFRAVAVVLHNTMIERYPQVGYPGPRSEVVQLQNGLSATSLLGSPTPLFLAGADPRLVQQNLLMQILFGAGSKAAATQGGKAAGGTLAKDAFMGWFSGFAGAFGVPSEDLESTLDPLWDGLATLAPEDHNVVLVHRGAPFDGVPSGFEEVELRTPIRGTDLLTMGPDEIHNLGAHLVADHTALQTQAVLGQKQTSPTMIVDPIQDQSALVEIVQFFDRAWRGYLGQSIIIHDTPQGVKVYQRFPTLEEIEARTGHAATRLTVVIDANGPTVRFQARGQGFDWSPTGIDKLAETVSAEHKEAFLYYVHALITELILGTTRPRDVKARLDEIRKIVTGAAGSNDPNWADGKDLPPDPVVGSENPHPTTGSDDRFSVPLNNMKLHAALAGDTSTTLQVRFSVPQGFKADGAEVYLFRKKHGVHDATQKTQWTVHTSDETEVEAHFLLAPFGPSLYFASIEPTDSLWVGIRVDGRPSSGPGPHMHLSELREVQRHTDPSFTKPVELPPSVTASTNLEWQGTRATGDELVHQAWDLQKPVVELRIEAWGAHIVVPEAALRQTALDQVPHEIVHASKVPESEPPKAKEALPLTYEFSPSLSSIAQSEKVITDTINNALAVVRAFPPNRKNHLFSWAGSRDVLANKNVHLAVIDTGHPFAQTVLGSMVPGQPAPEAATIFEEEGAILLVLFADKLFYDSAHRGRPDALVRTVTVLAHEIYGNVQRALEQPLTGTVVRESPEQRAIAEIRAFRESYAFYDRLMASSMFDQLFSENEQTQIQFQQQNEQAGVTFWTKQLNALSSQTSNSFSDKTNQTSAGRTEDDSKNSASTGPMSTTDGKTGADNAENQKTTSSENSKIDLQERSAVPFWFSFGPNQKEHEDIMELLLSLVGEAMAAVAKFPPAGDNLFSWSGPKDTLANKSFRVHITDSTDETSKAFGLSDISPDPVVSTALTRREDQVEIVVTVIEDLAFVPDPSGEPTKNQIARLIASLARQVYGYAQEFLTWDMEAYDKASYGDKNSFTPEEHVRLQQKAYDASVNLLGRMLVSKEVQERGPEFVKGLEAALEEETRQRDFWFKDGMNNIGNTTDSEK